MIFGIIYFLMVLQQVLMAYRLITRISRLLRPLMRVFGLPENAAYFWLVGNVLGISYGGAVMYDCLQDGNISHRSAVAVNRHLAMNHSLIEDTLVYASIGISVFWILATRVFFALVVVWGQRALRHCYALVKSSAHEHAHHNLQ